MITTAIKKLVLIASLLLIVDFATSQREMGNYYPRAFVVSELDQERDMVIVTDAVGYEWEFEEIEDWQIGDMVVAIMDSHGTENIFDDSFYDIRYAGYIDPVEYSD